MIIALVIILALVNLLLWSEVFYKQFFIKKNGMILN